MTANQDVEHLRILAIFHYVVGGIACLFACFPLIHFFVGAMMFFMEPTGKDPAIIGKLMGLFFVVISLAMMIFGWLFGIFLIFSGRRLAKHKSYMFCLVMAGIACLFMPFGTVLGVFTVIVLIRPSVKELFGVHGKS